MTCLLGSALGKSTGHEVVYDGFTTDPIEVARQIIVLPYIAAKALVTTAASGLLVIQPHFPCLPRYTIQAARGMMDDPPDLPFYITASSFSDVPRHLTKHAVVARTKPTPPTICHCRKITSNHAATENSEKRKIRASPTKTIAFGSDGMIAVVHYKATSYRSTKMERQVDVPDKNTERLSHSWLQRIGIADK